MKSSEKTYNPEFEALLEYLKENRGFDFTGYKRTTLMRRVSRLMRSLSLDSFSAYQDYLQLHPESFSVLFNSILINVTSFFRDKEAWEHLAQTAIQSLVRRTEDRPIRAWCAGCASGEEAFTLAILLAEALATERFRQQVKIYATDVDEEALNQARQATYSMKSLEPVAPPLREKYFEQKGNRYSFRKDLRRSVIFGTHDLTQDAPISNQDLVVCRNTLMYFNIETQSRILARLHFALRDDGFLFLGKAEMLIGHDQLFTPLDVKHRIFTKASKDKLPDQLLVTAEVSSARAMGQPSQHLRLTELAFEVAPIAHVMVDVNGIMVLANEQARTLFGLVSLDIGRPFRDLELSYRPVELRSRIEQVYAERRLLRLTNVERYSPNGSLQYLDVHITPLFDSDNSALGVSIVFADVTAHTLVQQQLRRSTEELETAYEELQSTNEELETTNEELQSTVEELETTNEELQSTNEELETMNEELQSTNEELQTINDELDRRSQELNRLNTVLESALTALNVAAVAVDPNLNVFTWDKMAENMWGLRADEVEGKPLLSLEFGLPVQQLANPLRDLLGGGSRQQELTVPATNRLGKQIQCRVTCTALVSPDSGPLGVMLLMEDLGR